MLLCADFRSLIRCAHTVARYSVNGNNILFPWSSRCFELILICYFYLYFNTCYLSSTLYIILYILDKNDIIVTLILMNDKKLRY